MRGFCRLRHKSDDLVDLHLFYLFCSIHAIYSIYYLLFCFHLFFTIPNLSQSTYMWLRLNTLHGSPPQKPLFAAEPLIRCTERRRRFGTTWVCQARRNRGHPSQCFGTWLRSFCRVNYFQQILYRHWLCVLAILAPPTVFVCFRAGFAGHLEAHSFHRIELSKGPKVLGFRNLILMMMKRYRRFWISTYMKSQGQSFATHHRRHPWNLSRNFTNQFSGLNHTLTRHTTFNRDIWPQRTLGPKVWTQSLLRPTVPRFSKMKQAVSTSKI